MDKKKYDFTLKTFKKNWNKPQTTSWWILICIGFFFAGIYVSGNYYQDQCNSFIIDNYLDPQSEYRINNPQFNESININLNLFDNETKISPIKQLIPIKKNG